MIFEWVVTAMVALAAGAESPPTSDPYAPQVPIEQTPKPTNPQLPTHQVICSDPKTISDCYRQARAECKGNFIVVKETDTDRKKSGGKGGNHKRRTLTVSPDSFKEPTSRSGEQRSMVYACGSATPSQTKTPGP